MPSFRFQGFATGSAVALTVAQGAASASAALTWGQPGGGGAPNATFSIVRVDGISDADLIAPAGMWFRATGFTGFSVTEPAGADNQYDPTQRVITFIWQFPDEGYTPLVTPNTPNVWKDRTVAYGKQVAHVFTTPGAKLVRCFAFDDAGNWGVAEFTTPPIIDPEVAFAGPNTIYFSPASVFPSPLPSGAQTSTSAADCRSKVNARLNAGAGIVRVSLARGQTYNDVGTLTAGVGGNRGAYIDSWGVGALPIVQFRTSSPLEFPDAERVCTVTGIDFRGDWDATTETGNQRTPYQGLGHWHRVGLFHRCKISGVAAAINTEGTAAAGSYRRIVSDCDVSSWSDYGLVFAGSIIQVAVLDSDIHQHEDALGGINQFQVDNRPIKMGNLHGPFRIPGVCPETYFARNSFFSNNGWSNSQNTAYTTASPTGTQAVRFNTDPAGVSTVRHHHFWDRNTFEGGLNGGIQLNGNGDGAGFDNGTQNVVIDKAIIIAGSMTAEFPGTAFKNVTMRNILGFLPNLERRGWGDSTTATSFGGASAGMWVHNCTIVNARTDASGPTSAQAFVVTGVGAQSSNNVHRASFKSIGASFEPLGTSAIAGVVCRNKGQRWNFPPIGIEFGSVTGNFKGPILLRDVRVGGIGDVLPGDSIDLPYPNYAGLCNGAGNALAPLTQAMANALPTHRHQLSIRDFGRKRMTDASRVPGSEGGMTITFNPTSIRVTNASGSTWPGSSAVWLQLDLAPYLMSHITATASAGTAVPAPIPQAGSAAIVANRNTGLWSHGDMLATYREGVKTPPSGAIQTGKLHRQGAFA